MAKAILICGKIASGKSYYVNLLKEKERAVMLSVDELVLQLFGENTGEDHDAITSRTKEYLLEKSIEILHADVDIILDWGFWARKDRDGVKEFYESQGIETQLHYIDVSEDVWHNHLKKRNEEVKAGKTSAYHVDEGLAAKCLSLFEAPAKEEIDVTYTPCL